MAGSGVDDEGEAAGRMPGVFAHAGDGRGDCDTILHGADGLLRGAHVIESPISALMGQVQIARFIRQSSGATADAEAFYIRHSYTQRLSNTSLSNIIFLIQLVKVPIGNGVSTNDKMYISIKE